MKNLKESNFNVTKKDIFTVNQSGDTLYKMFSFGKCYIVNDKDIQEKLISIEGYRPFILSTKPPIMIPIIVFAFILGVVGEFIFKVDYTIEVVVLFISFVLYVLSILAFHFKIYLILKKLLP